MKERVSFKNIWGIIYPMLIYLIIQYAVVYFGTIVITIVCSMRVGNDPETLLRVVTEIYMRLILMLNLMAGVVAIPLFVFLYHRDYTKSFLRGFRKKYEMVHPLKYALIVPLGVSTMMAANYFVSLLMQFMPEFMTKSYESTSEIIYSSSFAMQVVASAVMAPIVEELIFRGLVYNKIKRMTSVKIAAIISALLFGVYHMNWIQAPYAFLVGLMLVFVYEKYKSIAAPMLLHGVANFSSVLIAYFASGVDSDATSDLPKAILVISLLMLIVFMSGFVTLFSAIVHLIVKPKEVSNEVINHYDSML